MREIGRSVFPVIDDEEIAELARIPTRTDLWIGFVNRHRLRRVAEVGVWRGEFAEAMLGGCPDLSTYYCIDPWRHLDDWNKPANKNDNQFERFYQEVLARTEPWEATRVILRGRTTEVSDEIPDASLDLAYIDADHTLRGIAIDLIRIWPKVRPGGFVGGDDFSSSIWQHSDNFEPTLVFPFAVHFAEAMDARIIGLPHNQFLIEKGGGGFTFIDTTGAYDDPTLRVALLPDRRSGEDVPGRP